MGKKIIIDTEKFVKWLEQNIEQEKYLEEGSVKKGHYAMAIESREAVNVYEFIMRAVTGSQDDDPVDFIEEVEE